MPMLRVNGTELYYEDSGGSGAPILFSHGLLWNTALFAPQVAALKERYRCIAYDHRGQGRSAESPMRVIDMDTLAEDAAALIEALGLGRAHICGLSMGGFVAMRLGARRPELVRSLMLLETSADPEPAANRPKYRMMNWIARYLGIGLVAGAVMPILFGKSALADPARTAERAAWRREILANRRSIWRAVNGVLERRSVLDELPRIAAPTLVLVGEEDVATPPERAARIAAAIPGARLVHIPRAGHSATVEEPQAVTLALRGFLDGLG